LEKGIVWNDFTRTIEAITGVITRKGREETGLAGMGERRESDLTDTKKVHYSINAQGSGSGYPPESVGRGEGKREKLCGILIRKGENNELPRR